MKDTYALSFFWGGHGLEIIYTSRAERERARLFIYESINGSIASDGVLSRLVLFVSEKGRKERRAKGMLTGWLVDPSFVIMVAGPILGWRR